MAQGLLRQSSDLVNYLKIPVCMVTVRLSVMKSKYLAQTLEIGKWYTSAE
jgi:hypothetical protein